jgi:hypothetical protein
MDGRPGRTASSISICSVRLQTHPSALAGRVESGILQKTWAKLSSIPAQDYDYTPVQIR